MSGQKIKVMIVDDHEMVRRGLKAYLLTEPRIEWLGEASCGNEAVVLAKQWKPDVIMMDLMMENGTGIEATLAILAELPECKIVILTSYYDDAQVFPAIEAGATSYLLKTASSEEILMSIIHAFEGKSTIDEKVTQKMMQQMRQKSLPHDQLTPRERDVLRCVSKGMSNAEIGETLYIGIKTVKTHVSSIFSKLDVLDRTQAAIYAHQHKLYEEDLKH